MQPSKIVGPNTGRDVDVVITAYRADASVAASWALSVGGMGVLMGFDVEPIYEVQFSDLNSK